MGRRCSSTPHAAERTGDWCPRTARHQSPAGQLEGMTMHGRELQQDILHSLRLQATCSAHRALVPQVNETPGLCQHYGLTATESPTHKAAEDWTVANAYASVPARVLSSSVSASSAEPHLQKMDAQLFIRPLPDSLQQIMQPLHAPVGAQACRKRQHQML